MDHNDVLKNLQKKLKVEKIEARKDERATLTKPKHIFEAQTPKSTISRHQKLKPQKRKIQTAVSSVLPTYALIGSPKPMPPKTLIRSSSVQSIKDDRSVYVKVTDFLSEIPPPNRDGLEQFLHEREPAIEFLSDVETGSQEIDIYIGLDFGTAFTKVVIGESTYKYILQFPTGDTLLASQVWVDQSGKCYLQKSGNAALYDGLKMPLLNSTSTEIDRALICSFLALVFVECRRWFSRSPYKNYRPIWFINCGLPTKSTGNDSTKAIYSDLIFSSWVLSYCKHISLQNAARVLNLEIHPERFPNHVLIDKVEQINLYPEFIAQLTGYTRSPRRKPYSHLLIDVGAGTLDVSVFCIENSDDETFYKVVAEEVQNLGVEILNRYRLKVLNKPVSQLDEMQEKTDRDIASILKISEDDLNSVDEPFRNQINSLISGFMRDLRSGAMSIEEVTIILCGGGKYVSLYSQALEPVKRDFKIAPIDLEPIENLRGPDRAITEYHRYSVAAGLCDDPFNISKLQRHQLEQIDNSRRSEEFEQTIQNRRNEMYKG